MASPSTLQADDSLQAKSASQSSPSSASQREAVTFLVLFLLSGLAYGNTLLNNFVYDDGFQVVENPYVHSFRYLKEIFTTTVWSFQGAQGMTNYYRPLMTFGYLLSYQIAGAIPFSFHLANIVLHGLVVWLMFYMLRRFSGERVALVAAGLFALHPIHTESVAWIAAVTDLELSLFYLATFLLYLKLPEAENGFRARAMMCAAFAMALLSKEQAMTLPVLVMVFEHFYREDRFTTTLREKVSRYAPLWALAALYVAIRGIVLGGLAGVISRPGLSVYEIGLSAVSLTGQYLWKLLWPAHLSAFYVFHKSSHLTDAGFLLGLLGLTCYAVAFVILWRRAHILSFGILWLFFTLGPVLNARWMPASVFAERYLYLPSVGFCWLVGWASVKLWNARGAPDAPRLLRLLARTVPALLVIVALLYGMKTVTRNRDWRADEILFREALETQANASLILSNMGAIFYNRGDATDAEHQWLEALSAGPTNVFALDNMAVLRQQQQRYVEAIDYSRRALRARPAYTIAHVNLAETLALMGRTGEAEWQFRVATTLSPLSTRAHNEYGKFLLGEQRVDDARSEYERSVAVDSTTDAYDQLGDIYLKWKDQPRAERAFRSALRINAFDSHAHVGLGQVLEAVGRPAEALREYESGLETDPSDPIAKKASARLRTSAHPQASPH